MTERQQIRINALKALLEVHRCNADGRTSVAECVHSGQCGCSCGLLLRDGECADAGKETK
jgi:hypothetical protein